MTFAQFCEKYGKLKDAGKLSEAVRFMEKYRQQVVLEMNEPVVVKGQRSRFEREDPI